MAKAVQLIQSMWVEDLALTDSSPISGRLYPPALYANLSVEWLTLDFGEPRKAVDNGYYYEYANIGPVFMASGFAVDGISVLNMSEDHLNSYAARLPHLIRVQYRTKVNAISNIGLMPVKFANKWLADSDSKYEIVLNVPTLEKYKLISYYPTLRTPVCYYRYNSTSSRRKECLTPVDTSVPHRASFYTFCPEHYAMVTRLSAGRRAKRR